MNFFKKISMLVVCLIIFAINITTTEAAWNKSNDKWWYSDNSAIGYATGWKNIDNNWYYFDNSGFMKTGWFNYNGNWYYFYSEGNMAHDCYVEGYYINSYGAWTNTLGENENEVFITNENKEIKSENLSENINVYLSVNGEKYHFKNNCSELNGEKIVKTTLAKAGAMGFEKCNNCCQ